MQLCSTRYVYFSFISVPCYFLTGAVLALTFLQTWISGLIVSARTPMSLYQSATLSRRSCRLQVSLRHACSCTRRCGDVPSIVQVAQALDLHKIISIACFCFCTLCLLQPPSKFTDVCLFLMYHVQVVDTYMCKDVKIATSYFVSSFAYTALEYMIVLAQNWVIILIVL